MTRRVALAALVVPALVLVALTARSYKPFGDDETVGRRAPSSTFIDGAFTVVAVLTIVSLLIVIWIWLYVRPPPGRGRATSGLSSLVLFLIVIVTVVGIRGMLGYERRPGEFEGGDPAFPPGQAQPGQTVPQAEEIHSPQIVWPLAIGLAVLIAVVVVVLVVFDRRRSRPAERTPEELERLVRALDEAIEDLRREPDPRRAVVAAYARMEQALSFHGLPRRTSETPYEYLARVARELDAEEPAAALTELFEEAKFSEHSVDEAMRGRAIDALVSVRQEVQAAT